MKVKLLKKVRKKYSIILIEANSKYQPMAYGGRSFHRYLLPFPYYEASDGQYNKEYFETRKEAYNFLIKKFRKEFRTVNNKKIF